MTEHERILKAIERVEQKLDAWIETYKKAGFVPIQTVPTYDIDPNFGVSRCVKCGMEFRGSSGYVCSTFECPMGLGGTTS